MRLVQAAQFRAATAHDAGALAELEGLANVQALAHIFQPDAYPFPLDDVRDRWLHVIEDRLVRVGVAEDGAGLTAFVAHDDEVLRHLAVRPDLWGTGWARAAMEWASERGSVRRLWCLQRNDRALAFYRHLGWTPTGRRQPAEFPPHPVEVELVLPQR